MVVEVYRYLSKGWVQLFWMQPKFLFKYYGFEWVQPWPGDGLIYHWYVLGALAALITLGLFYRVAAALFFVGITYTFLLEQAIYLNHMYLICLLSFLLVFLPANRAWALDPFLRLAPRAATVPVWPLWILRLQLGVVYFYGGVAKINPDWLAGEPMRNWVSDETQVPIIGPYVNTEWMPYFLSYGGLLLDLAIVPLLLWRRTRLFAFVLAILFHILNAHMFHIGIFPWLGAAATTLFLAPDWPRKVLRFLTRRPFPTPAPSVPASGRAWQNTVLALAGLYALVQLLVPLRHYLYPGDVGWTYEGHRFSWRMKLHDREAQARFYVVDPNTGREARANPRQYLAWHQATKALTRPDMILQFAHFLAREIPYYGRKPLRVEARVYASLNGRKPELLVDPIVDLAAQPRTLGHADWIRPMTEPLPKERREKGPRRIMQEAHGSLPSGE